MHFGSPLFWILIALVILFMALKGRGKVRRTPRPEPGQEMDAVWVHSPLGPETPLACLMADDVKFGPLFEDKTPPDLPHEPGCACVAEPFRASLNQLYKGKGPSEKPSESALGPLEGAPKRYYKCRLIAIHDQASPSLQAEYAQLALQMRVDEDFKRQVDQQLQGES